MKSFRELVLEAQVKEPIYSKELKRDIGYIKTSREGDIINIDDIEVSRSGTGLGKEAIKNYMKKADKEGLIITLTSDAMRGKIGQKKNRELYKSLGFIKNSGANKRKDTTEEFYYMGKS